MGILSVCFVCRQSGCERRSKTKCFRESALGAYILSDSHPPNRPVQNKERQKRETIVEWYERKLKSVKICEKLKSLGKVTANMVQSSLFLTQRAWEWRTDWLPLFNKIVNHIFIQKSSHFIIDSMESLSGCSDAPCARFFLNDRHLGIAQSVFLCGDLQ